MLISTKRWTGWHRTDFFNHRVRIGVIVRAQADTVIPVLTAEARYINMHGASASRLYGPQMGGLKFSFWAGTRDNDAHEPRIRVNSDFPNRVSIQWFVAQRDIQRRRAEPGAEYRFGSLSDIHF